MAALPAPELEAGVAAAAAAEAPRELAHVLVRVPAGVEHDVGVRGEPALVEAGAEPQRDVHVGVLEQVAVRWLDEDLAPRGVARVLLVVRALDDPAVREAEDLGDGFREVVVCPDHVAVPVVGAVDPDHHGVLLDSLAETSVWVA